LHATVEEFIQAIHPEDRERITHAISLSLKADVGFYEEYRIVWPDETVHWLGDRGKIYRDQTGKPVRMIGVVMDVSARRQTEQHIMKLATHDMLTGLPNRYLLQDRIAQALAHDRRSQEQAAVLFIDLDHFKNINDSLGHNAGDLLLKEVAARLSATIRSEDTVARHGGDEFIVLLPNITSPQDAQAVAQKILDELIRPFQIHGEEFHIGGSIGIALFPNDGEDGEMLLKNSDAAMYHAKKNGRNGYQFFVHPR
jgi:diguanylate cyclase (GGDEF)-like protein